MMITLKTISDITGFSVSTVSKALNDNFEISETTRELIKNIADKNKYTPNKNALRLRKSKSDMIAVILPHINAVYAYSLCLIERIASLYGHKIVVLQSFRKKSRVEELVNELNGGIVDGVILLYEDEQRTKTYHQISGLPTKFIKVLNHAKEDHLLIDTERKITEFLQSIS